MDNEWPSRIMVLKIGLTDMDQYLSLLKRINILLFVFIGKEEIVLSIADVHFDKLTQRKSGLTIV